MACGFPYTSSAHLSSATYPGRSDCIPNIKNQAINNKYKESITNFYRFFLSLFEYKIQKQTEKEIKEKYSTFQQHFVAIPSSETVLFKEQQIPLGSKHVKLLFVIDELFQTLLRQIVSHQKTSLPSLEKDEVDTSFSYTPSAVSPFSPSCRAINMFSHSCSTVASPAYTPVFEGSFLPSFGYTELESASVFATPSKDSRKLVVACKGALLSSLPEDVLSNICEFATNDWQSLGNLAMTCKAIGSSVLNSSFLRSLFKSTPSLFSSISHPSIDRKLLEYTAFYPTNLPLSQTNLTDEDLYLLAKQGSDLQSIPFFGCQFSPDAFADFLRACPRLTSLELSQFAVENFSKYLSMIALYAKQLEHIKIKDCPVDDESLFALAFYPLEHLLSFSCENSTANKDLTDYALLPFFMATPRLQSIQITGCPRITSIPLTVYIEDKMESDFDKRRGMQLKEISFSGCGSVEPHFFVSLKNFCPNIEILDLGFSSKNEQKEVGQEEAGIGSEMLGTLAENYQKLHTLKLVGFTGLSSRDVGILLNGSSFITTLEIENTDISLDDFFSVQLSHLPNLTHLKIKTNNRFIITKQYLHSLKMNCPGLVSLTLTYCVLNERDVLAFLPGCRLKTIQFIDCGSFGAPLLCAIAENLPELENLEIEIKQEAPHQKPFDDVSVGQFLVSCKNLKMLSLHGSPTQSAATTISLDPWKLTDITLKNLARYSKYIEHLSLSHLDLSTPSADASIKTFVKQRVNLIHLGFPSSIMREEQALALLSPYRNKLHGINLTNNSFITEVFFENLSICPGVAYLWLSLIPFFDNDLLSLYFPNLKFLENSGQVYKLS